MGRGTKHKADWKETTLQVVIDARRLYCHSVKIMGNEKVFNPKNDFQNSTLIKIQESLLSVYTRVWDANRIRSASRKSAGGSVVSRTRFTAATQKPRHLTRDTVAFGRAWQRGTRAGCSAVWMILSNNSRKDNSRERSPYTETSGPSSR